MTITQSSISISSKWGQPAKYLYLKHTHVTENLAVVFPGKAYALQAPITWYACQGAMAAGYDVIGVEYGFQANSSMVEYEDIPIVAKEVASGLKQIGTSQYKNIVFIGKSLGTEIAVEVSKKHSEQQSTSHVFLTPTPGVIDFLEKVHEGLVVVGSEDAIFHEDEIRIVSQLTGITLCMIPNANHRLEVPNDYKASLRILSDVAEKCEKFCKAASVI